MQNEDSTQSVRAVVIRQVEGEKRTTAQFENLQLSDLPDGDVLVKVAYSTLNYKDGMALTGARIARRLPMVGGIDLAGTVVSSRSSKWNIGDRVLVNGHGMSETVWGGFSTYQRLKSDWLVKVPDAFSLEEAMAIGTAGYTSMLCVMALESVGLMPGGKPVLVTGAAGGVGSVAVSLLSALGYEVTASTGRQSSHSYLRDLGATTLIGREAFADAKPGLGAETWSAAIDCVGGETLAAVLTQIVYGGSVAACGLAGGSALPATVLPFILRSVNLLGVDSVMAPMEKRVVAWSRLATDLPKEKLLAVMQVHDFEEVLSLAPLILEGRIQGRVVIRIGS
jgi:acrylyl-CoA reductase (NADPH)